MSDGKKLLDALNKVDMGKVPDSRKLIDKMLATLAEVEDDLSNWENEFVYDLTVRFTQHENLTEPQFNKLREIYDRYEFGNPQKIYNRYEDD